MTFATAAYTDAGIRKKTNQDSLLVQRAQTDYGEVLLATLCDGMGGLAKGEVASACVVQMFSDWFCGEFPALLYQGLRPDALCESWDVLIKRADAVIKDYGKTCGAEMGTTCVALLIAGGKYYTLNVGDSRIYLITDYVYRLTKDHTFVQRELDANRMTYEQSLVDSRRNVLLRCIGASDVVVPDYTIGTAAPGQCFLLCSDGFRHEIESDEFFRYLGPGACGDKRKAEENLRYLTELNKERRETDNITAAWIRIYG